MRPLNYIAILIGTLCLFSCTKYPENKLNSRHPERYFKGGVITMYTENNIDKMGKIRSWYSDFPYNYYGTKITDVFASPFSYNMETEVLSTEYGTGYLHFNKGGKTVDISFTPINSDFGAQNIFVQNENWQILKLTKEGVMKIKATINYKYYEIQFN